jgi:RimJ/RimL family protein N-acetyltransferase
MPDLHHFSTTEELRDGTRVTIRSIRPDDRERLIAAFRDLDPRSIYSRFFEYKTELTEAEVERTVDADFVHQVALVATIGQGAAETIIGGGQYFVFDAGGERAAEIAFTIEEDYQGKGLAGRVLHHLIRIARGQGLARFEAEVLPENAAMLTVFSQSGLPITVDHGEDSIHVTLDLSAPPGPA